MTSGHFAESLKIAHDQYQFESLYLPGLLPLGIIIDDQRYQLLTKPHPGICDNKACRIEAIKKISKNEKYKVLYEEFPLYSNLGKHEICIYCAQLSTRQTYKPTIDESRQILEILGYDPDQLSSDECDCESNECDCESNECDCESEDGECESEDGDCESEDGDCESEDGDCESDEFIKRVNQIGI